MAIKIQFRRDTSANWSSNNPILAEAELGFDTTKKQFKVGDGVTAWNSLGWLKTEQEDIEDIIGAMTSGNTESGISVTYDDANGVINFDVNDPTLSISGDATGSSTMTNLGNTDIVITHANTGVTAGSYGSASEVPIIAVDSKGRITSASTTSVAGVTDFDYNTSTGELDIDTADGANFATTVTLDPFSTDDLVEGSTNQYYTDTRVRNAISLTDNGGDGSFTYNSTTGELAYTGPSSAEVRAHLSAGTGVSYAGGQFSIGQAVATTDSPEFADVTISGDSVATQAYVNTEVTNLINGAPGVLDTLDELAAAINDDANFAATMTNSLALKADKAVTLTAGTGLTGGGDLSQSRTFNLSNTTVTAGTYGDASNVASFTVNAQGRITGASDTALVTTNITEGTNLYYTDARVHAAVSGTGDLQYDAAGNFSFSLSDHDTDDVAEGSTNLYYTDTRVKNAIQASTGLTYNSTSGAFSITDTTVTAGSYGSASEVPVITVNAQGQLTAASTVAVAGVTDFDYDTTTGVLDIDTADGGNFAATVTLDPFSTTDLVEGSNLYYTDTRAKAAITVSNAGGFGNLSITTSGQIDYQGITTEEVQDVVGDMISTNTESGISVTYDDTNGKLDFDVNDPTITLTGDVSGSATMTDLGNVSITTTVADDSHDHTIANVDGLQAALDTKATITYVDNEITTLIGGAPGTLDTLNELAAAINDDANYASTLTTALATKADKSTTLTAGTGLTGGGDLSTDRTISLDTSGVTAASYGSATQVPVITVDTYGRITSASTTSVAGVSSVSYTGSTGELTINTSDGSTYTNDLGVGTGDSPTFAGLTANGNITVTGTVDGRDVATDGTKLDGIEAGATGDQTAAEILTALKTVDGAGSGLDADTLDGKHASNFASYTEATTAPSTGVNNGDMWYDTATEVLSQYQDGVWVQISTQSAPAIIVYDVAGTIVN